MVTEVKQLIGELPRRRWTQFRWGPERDPELVAWIYAYRRDIDVIMLRGEDDATGYRKPLLRDGDDPWNPTVVAYQYHATAVRTLRAMLALPPPGEDGAPNHVERATRDCALPHGLPSPIVIRPLGVPR